MKKVFGKKKEFSLLKVEGSQIVIGYGMADAGNGNATWYEIRFNRKQKGSLTIEEVKEAVIECINSLVTERILSGYEWTVLHGSDEGKTVKVWLSAENQANFKAKHDTAVAHPDLVAFPIKYKVSEDEDKNPVYENFQTLEELVRFYLGGVAYIESCYQAG